MSSLIDSAQPDSRLPKISAGMATARPTSVVISAIAMPLDSSFGSPVTNSVMKSKVATDYMMEILGK